MSIARALATILLLTTLIDAFASDAVHILARKERVAISLPEALNGPYHEFPNDRTELDVFVSSAGMPPVLVQLMRITLPPAPPTSDEQHHYMAAADFLKGFLQLFSKNVSNWSHTEAEPFRLDGVLAARARWAGSFHGYQTAGVMYLFILGKEAYCIHAFGRSDVPNPVLNESIRAAEKMQLKETDMLIK